MSCMGILSSLGSTASQAINVFCKQITFRNSLPFPMEIFQKKINGTSKESHGRKSSQ